MYSNYIFLRVYLSVCHCYYMNKVRKEEKIKTNFQRNPFNVQNKKQTSSDFRQSRRKESARCDIPSRRLSSSNSGWTRRTRTCRTLTSSRKSWRDLPEVDRFRRRCRSAAPRPGWSAGRPAQDRRRWSPRSRGVSCKLWNGRAHLYEGNIYNKSKSFVLPALWAWSEIVWKGGKKFQKFIFK